MGHSHLVGSVNLPDAESVFRAVAEIGGQGVARIPDGETDRTFVIWFLPTVLAHQGLVREPGGAMGGLLPRVSVKPEAAAELDFGELGFAAAAAKSFKLFSALKDEGVIPAATRFQVSIPSALTLAISLGAVDQQPVLGAGFKRTFEAEVRAVADAVPHEQLAIQFDMPGEIGGLEGVFPCWLGPDPAAMAEEVRSLAGAVPPGVELGFHLCYGSPPEGERYKHWADPVDTGVMVGLINAIAATVTRPINWFHIPVPMDRDDEAYYRPLAGLKIGHETQMFLGLVHDLDGAEGTARRINAAKTVLPTFGVSAECGLGRMPADAVPEQLRLQREFAAAM